MLHIVKAVKVDISCTVYNNNSKNIQDYSAENSFSGTETKRRYFVNVNVVCERVHGKIHNRNKRRQA